MAICIPQSDLELARARMLEVFPNGFEECVRRNGIELAGYVSPRDAESICEMLDGAQAAPVASGWETAWQDFHRPVRIGHLWLGPPWETPPPGVRAVTVAPGMAFGTGAHATTRLCVELLLEETPGPLVDLGCGSGVLAVVAGVLGFKPVIAVDIDFVAVAETREQARRNGVEIDVRHSDAAVLDIMSPRLVTANLPLAELKRVLGALRPARAIAAGFRVGDGACLPGYTVARCRQRDGWDAVRFDREDLAGASGVYS